MDAISEHPDLSQLPDRFDAPGMPVGRPIYKAPLASGRAARYIDDGEPGWQPLVFFGGLGTSVGAFYLTEFARSLRVMLRVRVISVERNGFGRTPFDPSLGYDDAAEDVLAVLEALDVERFSIVAFSGGGPYAAALAARAADRLVSLHLAAAAAGSLTAAVGTAASNTYSDATALALDPRAMWQFPARSPVHLVPGFARAAGEEGVHALGRGDARVPGESGADWPTAAPGALPGQGADAVAHDWHLLQAGGLPDLSAVSAPGYLYWGTSDDVVPPEHAHAWGRALPNVVARREYDGEGHDVQYRHWDQILVDAALPHSRTMICREGQVSLVADAEAPRHLAAGATLGLCAWADQRRAAA